MSYIEIQIKSKYMDLWDLSTTNYFQTVKQKPPKCDVNLNNALRSNL